MTRAFSVRYQAQDALFTLAGETLRRKLKALKQGWEKRISPDSRAVDAVLPFEILLLEMQLGNSIPLPAFRQLAAQPASSGSQSGYRRWLQLLHEGKAALFRHAGSETHRDLWQHAHRAPSGAGCPKTRHRSPLLC